MERSLIVATLWNAYCQAVRSPINPLQTPFCPSTPDDVIRGKRQLHLRKKMKRSFNHDSYGCLANLNVMFPTVITAFIERLSVRPSLHHYYSWLAFANATSASVRCSALVHGILTLLSAPIYAYQYPRKLLRGIRHLSLTRPRLLFISHW